MRPITQSDLALSTMWNFRKASSGRELVDQLLALGFTAAEFNYQVRAQWLEDIRRAVDAGEIKAASLHNVFPKTMDDRFDTDSMLLGYLDEGLRRQAVELSKRSVDWACRLGAGAVVFHPTEVPLAPEAFDVPLKKMIAEHQTHTDAYRALNARMRGLRQSEPYLSQTLRSLDELATYVTVHALPVKLGMENRAMCHQVPIYAEFDVIARRFDQSCVGLWLDTGHGIMMQEMGLQSLPLSDLARRNLVGMHIHDAKDGLDHYAPYTLDEPVLDPFLPYILKSPIKVLELSGRLSAQEITRGTQRFLERYNRFAAEKNFGAHD